MDASGRRAGRAVGEPGPYGAEVVGPVIAWRKATGKNLVQAFTLPASAACYWVGEAMHKKDFKDLPEVPKEVAEASAMLASNAAHLARLLAQNPYPGQSG